MPSNNNPIKSSDLVQDDGAIKVIIGQLSELVEGYTALIKKTQEQAVELEKASRKTTGAGAAQKTQVDAQAKAADELAKTYEKYTTALSKTGRELANAKLALQDQTRLARLEAKVSRERAGSYEALNAQLKVNKERLAQLNAQGKINTKEGVKLEASTQRLTARLDDLKTGIKEATTLRKLEEKLARSAEGSYDALSAQYRINKIALNAMGEEQRKSTQAGQELEETTRGIYEEMKELQRQTGKNQLNVGNYSGAIKDASKEQRRLVKELEETKEAFRDASGTVGVSQQALDAYEKEIVELTEQIDNLGAITGKTSDDFGGITDQLLESEGALGDAARGVQGLGKSFKALLANPVVLFLAIIAGALITLFQAFTRSEKGAQLMAKATGIANAALSQLTDLSVRAVEFVEAVFEDPQAAIKSFGKLLVDQVLNRVKAIPLLAKAAGDAFSALWNRDIEGLKKASNDAFTAVTQLVTSLDADQQSAFADAVRETVDEVVNETNAFIKLEEARRSVARANRALAQSIEGLTTQEQLAQSIADDTTKSFKEREEAAERARAATEARAAKEIQLARNNLGLINQELSLRRANGEAVEGLLDQQLGAYRELAAAERDLTLAVRDNERTRAELKQDRLERDLDILIDGFDNQKTINERIIADDRRTLEERRKLLDETTQLADDSFAKQIETIQEFTGIQLDANALIAESDAVALNDKIRSLGLSEIIEGRLLEIVRERRLANQDLAEATQDLADKEAAAAQAAIKANEKRLATERSAALKRFDEQQDLKQSEFDLLEKTEAEKTRFRLQAEADRLAEVIRINEDLEGDLSDTVVETYKNRIAGINAELAKVNDGEDGDGGLLSKLGIELNDEQKEALTTAGNFIKAQLLDIFNLQKQLADQAVANADRRVSSAEAALQAEITAAANGSAANIETKRQELAAEKRLQEEALDRQQKAARAQRRIQTGQQAVNLITATSKIFASLPIFAAIPAVALMFGTFVASKIKAGKLARQNFAKGGYEEINTGGSHGTGRDTFIGVSGKNKAMYAQRGESLAVFNRAAVRRDGNRLPGLVNMINRGSFDDVYIERELVAQQGLTNVAVNGGSTDTRAMERSLAGIEENTAVIETTNSNGQRVVRRGWETTTYVN